MAIASALRQFVWDRAGARCEYCHFPSNFDILPFCIDHIGPQKHSGRTTVENLALSCSLCNRFKLDNLAGIDPDSSQIVPLFNPRLDAWHIHFVWKGPQLIGLTSAGRATIEVLRINLLPRIQHREILILLGNFNQR